MSTQSYYKDRLGFDPREALYDNNNGEVQQHHTSSSSTSINNNHHHQQHQQQQYHQTITTTTTHRHSIGGSGGGAVATSSSGGTTIVGKNHHYYNNGGGGGSPGPGNGTVGGGGTSPHNGGGHHHQHHHNNNGEYYHTTPAKRHRQSFTATSPATGSSLNVTSQGGYEDALTQFKDERDAIQKKTFTKWVNKHLKKASRRVDDLFEDLRDGHNLLSLLEVLSGEHLPREKGKMRFHMLQNAQMALDFLRYKKIKLVNIRAEDIVDGNPKLTLGLIWTIILHFQISDIVVGQEDNLTAREALLRWARRSTAKYPGVRVNDFTSSWRDGLAFSALIHRNRPDLIDWRESRSRRPRERLEVAFHVVEKEYGVTRLLDPEDVDTNEPDEKSMITYLSSLYDVFPEPPQMHPLFDMDSQRRVQEYREQAQQLLYWCREKTSLLQERAFPTTLIELKRLLTDLNRFRTEEVPPRQRDKQHLFSIYKELEKYFESIGEVDVETELRPEALEKAWHRLMSALADRDSILQQEVQRLERLQKIAEKVQREYKHTETIITKIETRISEESRRIERLHPVEAKNIVEGLDGDIRHLEQPLQEMNDDCHNLKDGRYPQASDLHKKVTKLHQRWSQLRTTFHTSLVQKLSGLSYPVQETTITKQTRVVTETRQIGTNPYFRDVQEYTEWCQSKLKQLHTSDYGSDLPSAKVELERHQHEHKVIDQFHSKIAQCERHASNFTGEELQLYRQRLSQLQKVYAELLSTSTKRLSDLDALVDFLATATAELSWLNDREQIEVSRDWADKNLDLSAVHRYYENLMSELEKREMHFATILDRGEALLVQSHPASKCIEGHLQALQSQWSWLLQLTLCLEVHLKHATDYHSFFDEVREAENWLTKRDEILNSKYSQSEFTLDQGESLLRGMQDIREELNAFGETIAQLQHQATAIVPLKQRKQPVNRQCTVQSICSYKQGNISLDKNETCTLLDTSGRVKWRVKTSKGVEGSVHGVCLLLPPPDQEAIEAAERLKRLFDRSVALWQKKQLRLRQNMIFATIKVVKGWDFEQFLAMGAEQRTAIRRALNDDADKLSKQASRIFTEQCISLKTRLEEMARELDHIILSPMPRDLDSLEHTVQILEDYKRRLGGLEPDLKHLQETFRTITLKTPALKKSLDNLMDLWKELNTQAGLHGDRLKLLEGALAGLEDNEQVISDLEGKLSRQLELPSTQEGLYEVYKRLTAIQETISSQQPEMDKMNDSADQLGRMGVPTKVLGDLKRLHSNVERLNSRWNNICGQLAERMRSVETAIGLMKNLQTSIVVEETWVEKQTEKLQALPTATSARELDSMLGETVERIPKVEQVNLTGGRLIREAKIYDGKCVHYIDWLSEVRPSFSPPRQDLRPANADPGATEVYSKRLDTLNGRFETLLEQLTQRLKTAIEVNGADGLRYAESLHKPLRTYRVEFNLGRPANNGTEGNQEVEEDIYTSTYSTSQITKITNNKLIYDTIDKNGMPTTAASQLRENGSPTKAKPTDGAGYPTNGASSVQFTEIRSLKRIQRTSEAVGTNGDEDGAALLGDGDNILNTPGIIDPTTGRTLTVGEAIRLRVLDVRSGLLNVSTTGERISLEEAALRQLIDPALVGKLLRPGAALDRDGRPLSLLEVIQKEILEAENGGSYESTEKRIKVTTEGINERQHSGSSRAAIADGGGSGGAAAATVAATTASSSSSQQQQRAVKYSTKEAKSIVDAIKQGLVDVTAGGGGGLYRTPSGRELSLADAYECGYLVRSEAIKIAPHTLCLADALAQGLVDTGGWVTDRNTGDTFRLDSAIERQLIDPHVREVVDTKHDTKVTVAQALEQGIINARTGRYMNPQTKEKLTFAEARHRQLIGKPLTLKDVCDLQLYDQSERIASPTRRERVNIPGAISLGVLDGENVRSIFKTSGAELLTLAEAMDQGIVLPFENRYRHHETGELMTIPEAVDRGLISSVSIRSIFNIHGFKDPHSGEFVSFNMALAKNVLRKRDGQFMLDSGKGVLLPLGEAVGLGLVRPEVYEMFNRAIGVQDDRADRELSLIELVYRDHIDPKTGFLLDAARRVLPLEPAIERKFITPEGALLLISLLNITLTTETVTKTIKRYVTITHTGEAPEGQPQVLLSFTEAVRQGLIDEQTRTYRDPATGNLYSIQQALNHGLLLPDTEALPEQAAGGAPSGSGATAPIQFETRVVKGANSRTLNITTEYLERADSELQTFELPANGWPLNEAIERQLLNPDTGLLVIPGTDRLVSFEECIKLQIINRQSAFVSDPKTPERRVTIDRALEKKILDPVGRYSARKGAEPLTMRQAIEQEYIIFEQCLPSVTVADGSENRTIQVTKRTGQPDRVEISNPSAKNSTLVEVKVVATPELMSPEPLQLAPGVIYDPSTALVIFAETGRSDSILGAVAGGKIDPSLVQLVDPANPAGEKLSIAEAIKRGLIDEQTGEIRTASGPISMIEAIQKGLLLVAGAPLVAAAGAIDSLKLFTDPVTGEEIPIELAYERGLITRSQLPSPERAALLRKKLSVESRRSSEGITTVVTKAGSLEYGQEPKKLQKMRKCVLRPKDAAEQGIIDADTAQKLEDPALFSNPSTTLADVLKSGQLKGESGRIVDPQRGHVLNLKQAAQRGILDLHGTNMIFVPIARCLSLPALETQGLLNPSDSRIYHPESGQLLTLREALLCEIVDPLAEITVNEQSMPLEQAISAGLVDEDRCTIGGELKIVDAIDRGLCQPSNYESKIPPIGMSLPVVVERGLLDVARKEVTHPISRVPMPLESALRNDFIMATPYTPDVDGVQLLDAIDRGRIDTTKGTYKTPLKGTAEIVDIPLREAIDTGKLIVKPLPKLIQNLQANHAVTSVQETVAAFHTITTKTVEIQSGYALISANEVQDLQTGAIMSVDEAVKQGIMTQPEETREELTQQEVKIGLNEALQRGLLDVTKGTFIHPSTGEVMSISVAVDRGFIGSHSSSEETLNRSPEMSHKAIGKVDVAESTPSDSPKKTVPLEASGQLGPMSQQPSGTPVGGVLDRSQVAQSAPSAVASNSSTAPSSGSNIGNNIKDAAKLGLMAVVGAPVLGGMAIAGAVKKAFEKKDKGDTASAAGFEVVGNIEEPTVPFVNLATDEILDPTANQFAQSQPMVDSSAQKMPAEQDTEKAPEAIEALENVEQLAKAMVEPVKPEENSTVKEELKAEVPSTTDGGAGSKLMDAAKLGLMAVVGAPLLAGKAVVDALKSDKQPAAVGEVVATGVEPTERHVTFVERPSERPERMTLGEAISQGKIDPKHCRILVDDKQMPYTVEEGLNQGNVRIYDVVDVLSKERISFVEGEEGDDALVLDASLTEQRLGELGVYDVEKGYFLDPTTGERVSFRDFIYNAGALIDPTTIFVKDLGRNRFERLDVALKKHLIDKHTGHMLDNKTGKKIKFVECCRRGWIVQREPAGDEDLSPTLAEVIDAGQINPQTGEFIQNNESIPIAEALRAGFIDNDSLSVRDPTDGQIVPLAVAIEKGIIDLKLGVLFNKDTQEEIDLNEAYVKGYMLEGKRKPISLEAAVLKGLYNPESGLILDTITEEMVDVQQSVDKGIVDPKISNVKDTKENTLVPLQDALDMKLIDAESGKLKDTASDQLMALDVAVEKNLMDTKHVTHSLIDVLSREFYNPATGKILDPANGDESNLKDAINTQLVEIDSVLIRDEARESVVKCRDAIASGLVDDVRGVLTRPELTLDRAYQKGYVLSNKKPISLADALLRGFYDPTTGKLLLEDAPAAVTLEQAIGQGEISTNDLIVRDPKSGTVISLAEAIRSELVDPAAGLVVDSASGLSMGLGEAMDRGLIVASKRRCSLPDAVYRGLYDPKSGQFSSTTTPERMSTERAIRRGLLDPESTIVTVGGKIVPFELAIENGTVDVRRGTIRDDEGVRIDFREAFDRGLLVEVRKPIGLSEAVLKGIYREGNGKFVHAFDIGLLYDRKAPVSLQRAIHQGIYDDKTGKFVEPATGRKITLQEATRKFIINPQLPCYFNERDETMLNLFEACRAKLIDRREGVFREPGSEVFIPLSEALALGLIVDIESAGFGLYETLAMGFYRPQTGQILHPITGRQITLEEACDEDIVSPAASIVKIASTGRYVRLDEAIEQGVVDAQAGMYNLPEGKVNLQEARRRGLIVTNQKLLSLEKAIKMGLYRGDEGGFVEPSSGDLLNLQEALDAGLLDFETTVYKDAITGQDKPLRAAMHQADIDVDKGKVLDRKNDRAYNFDVAFGKGLLVTVNRPITGKILERKESIDNLLQESPIGRGPKEMSLQDALRHDLLSLEVSVVRDPRTGLFVPLRQALQDGVLQEGARATVDPKLLFFTFDNDCVVYVREPLSFDRAVECQLLDLTTGRFLSVPSASTAQPGPAPSSEPSAATITLRDAIVQGLIDPESVLLKDGAKRKLLHLPEAFRKGLIEPEKSNVLDTASSKLVPLQAAVETGLLTTPRRAFGLLEALDYQLYAPAEGNFRDPFHHAAPARTLTATIEAGLIDPSTTVVRDSVGKGSAIVPLASAIASGLVDAARGHYHGDDREPIDLVQAREKGYLLLAEQRQAVIEKFALCEDHLAKLLEWITRVEQDIAAVGGPKERVDDLRNQINSLKQIKEDIDGQSRPVASCLDQVRQLVLTGGDVLSAPEVAALETSGRELRARVDKAQDRTGKLLRRLGAARDELGKLRTELDTFSSWLQSSRRTLEDKESTLSDLHNLPSQSDTVKEFHSDVIAHQADLRFITMSAQKFVDECKDYLGVLNDFRTTLPDRLPHIEQISSSDSPIRQEVSLVTAQYRDLLNRANVLLDRLAGLGNRQRDYQESLEKVRSWLRDVQPRVSSVLSDPIAADPQSVQDQMNQTKALQSEFLSQGRLLDNVQHSLDALLKSLAGRLSPSEVSALEIPVEEVKDKYSQLLEALGDRSKLLDTALVQSQGVQDALDGLAVWINQSEEKFKLQNRPASLIKDRLNEQVREHRGLLNDLESHRTSLESVTLSAQELMATPSNTRLAKRIESNLSDVTGRFEKLLDKALKRGEFLEDTMSQLTKFLNDSSNLEHELTALNEALEGRELASLPAEVFAQRMVELSRAKEDLRPQYEATVRLGKDLVAKRDVTDTGVVRDLVKVLENLWKTTVTTLEEKLKLSKQKAEQLHAYENLKDQVLVWLSSIETRTNNLAPVAVDVDAIKFQIEEVRPLVKEHREYGVTIDRVNDLGAQYDALIRPDSPTRKRSVYSPIKRSNVSPMRRMSGDARSPSPTKGGPSPLSPASGSSGFGSRRSSQDGFQLTDLTPIQQQLTEINNRYSLVGARLNDRQNELDSVRDEVRKHQENLKTLASFLDKIHRQVPRDVIGNKEEADRCNKQARKILEEMYERQSLLDSTKAQVKDLLKRKPDVQGAERLRAELDTVADRWKNLNDLCKDRITFSEHLRDFLDTHDNLNTWLAAKERMLTVLGPISSDPRMVQSQVQQVQVLREEFRGQQPQLNHLQEVGNAVLEHLRESSPEGQAVSTKLRNVQKKWDELVARLDERAQSLGAAADSSKEFDAGLNRLREALQTISDNLDSLPTDRDHQETLRKIENLERQLEGQRPLLADSEAAAETLCRVLSDPVSRADVNARVAAVGKQYQTLQKKLDMRKAETDAALRDGRQFAETCAKTLGWLSGELGNLTDRLLVSAHRPTLQHQIDTHEPVYREVMGREHEVIMLLNKGRDLQDRPGQTTDRGMQRDLEKIAQQWDRLRSAADDAAALRKPLQSVRKLAGEIAAEARAAGGDGDHLKSEVDGISDRIEDLHARLDDRCGELQSAATAVSQFNDQVKLLGVDLNDLEQQVDSLHPPAREIKVVLNQLDEVAGILGKIDRAASNVSEVERAGEQLVDCGFAPDTAQTRDQIGTLRKQLGRLENRARDHDDALQRALKALEKFYDLHQHTQEDLGDVSDQLKKMKPVSSELEQIRHQQEDFRRFRQRVVEPLTGKIDELNRLGQDLIRSAQGGVPTALLEKDLEKINDRWNDLKEKMNERERRLDVGLLQSGKFQEALDGLSEWLKVTEEMVANQKPPSADYKVVKAQLADQPFLMKMLSDRQETMASMFELGQEVAAGCDASEKAAIERQLKELMRRLDDLTDAAQRRTHDLEQAMHVAKQFQDQLIPLTKWLDGAERAVKAMELVPTDEEKIQARIREHEQLHDEILSKKPDFTELADIAAQLMELVGDDEAVTLSEKVKNTTDRYTDLVAVMETLKELQEALQTQEPPAAQPQAIQKQQVALQEIRQEIDQTKPEVEQVRRTGSNLMSLCGEPDKPEVKKHIEDLDNAWDNITALYAKREENLIDAMEKAMEFHETLQNLLSFLKRAEERFQNLGPLGSDIEAVKKQIEQLKHFKDDVDPHMVEVEALNRQAVELTERTSAEQAGAIREPLNAVNRRWENLLRGMVERQKQLEHALLHLGQFQHALNELLVWINKTDANLDELKPIPGDPQLLEVELAKLKVLANDIHAHQSSVDTLNDAGRKLIENDRGSLEASTTQDKLQQLNKQWRDLLQKAADRQHELEESLREAQAFTAEIQDLLGWLGDVDAVISASKPVGGLPETASEQLERFMEVYNELEENRAKVETLIAQGQEYVRKQTQLQVSASNLQHTLRTLKQRWDAVVSRASDKKIKLEIALKEATEFHDALQAFVEWLTQAEKQLSSASAVSRVLETIQQQMEEHKVLQKDVSIHRESMLLLDKKGTHLKYFSQKQDLESDLDKRSAQMQSVMKTGLELERSDETRETSKHLKEMQRLWDDVQDLSGRRKSRLDVALKEAERLHKSVHMLLEWLSEAEQKLRFAAAAPDDESQAKDLLDTHAKFMKELREKEYDKEDTIGLANSILGKAHPDAIPIIKNWISIIQSRWDEISQWAISRQTKLEQHLKDLQDLDESIEELLAWLAGLEATLLNLETEPLPDEIPPLEVLIADHKEFMENTARRQGEVDRACKPRQPPPGLKETRKPSRGVLKTPIKGSQADLREHSPDYSTLGRKQRFGSRDQGLNSRRTSRATQSPGRETQTPERDRLPHYGPRFSTSNQADTELRSPRAKLLWEKWRYVWMLAWERQRRLHDHMLYLQDVERVRQFSWEEWRKRFLKFMNHKKSRLTDLFRKMDKDNNGLIPREVFIDGIIGTKFDTSKLEMGAVADLFDRNGEGLIDWQEFIAALRPDWQDRKPKTEADKIHDEVKRLVMLCTCRQKFRVFQVGEGKYRFGDSQKLRLVRILRSTVMVRVGGGWVALDEFLVKNDPCRAKGRTNIELREQFILADGVSQSMAAFKPRMSGSAGSGSNQTSSPIPTQGPIVKVRERSAKSISMSRPSRSSLSASTPDSLSDNESGIGTPGRFQTPSRKSSVPASRSQMTPGGSRANSRPSSRPASRAGSKPPSRHGSTLSLDSTDDATPSRIPTRRLTQTSTPRPSRLSVGSVSGRTGTTTTTTTNGVSSRTASGAASPAPTRNGGMSRSSSIPTLIGLPNSSQPRSRIPVRQTSNVSNSSSATGKTSGASTPSGMQTPRRTSVEPGTAPPRPESRNSRGTTPSEKRAPFRL
uniref:Microtubule-actin cross-linking factor 1 n=1 Tax=Anopheles coluzzii TaxID=1518534 RepID=A0A8W7Q4N6_ANOCL